MVKESHQFEECVWTIYGINFVADKSRKAEFVLDTGAGVHVWTKELIELLKGTRLVETSSWLRLSGAGGHSLRTFGERVLKLNFGGARVRPLGQIAEIKQPILSAARLISSGLQVNLKKARCRWCFPTDERCKCT